MNLLPKLLASLLVNLLTSSFDSLNLDALSLSKSLEDRQLTAVDLMHATLDRIDAINPKLNAIVSLKDRQVLLQLASDADNQLLMTQKRKGWLHGIPIAVKDLFDVEGFPTTMGGSPLYNDLSVATTSEPFVQRLVDAGAIVIGKTNTPEAGLGSHTYNERWGTTLNPYHTSLSAGGSSGGAAVAVATKMLAIADGSDMMGSLRNPAGWNHLYSFRPTAGLVEYYNNNNSSNNNLDRQQCPASRNPLGYPISTASPIARSVRDMAAYLATMIGFEPDKFNCHSHAEKRFRVAWLGDWNGAYPMETGILDLCRQALTSWAEKKSISLVEIKDLVGDDVFPAQDMWNSWTTIRSAVVSQTELEKHGIEALLGQSSRVREELKWEVRQGMAIGQDELEDAGRIAKEWSKAVEVLFQDFDAIALPSAQVWPFPSNWKRPNRIGNREMDTYHRWMEVVVPASLAGLPVVTIPAGFSPQGGLPMGIQLIGRRFEEENLLQLAQCFQQTQ